MVDIFMQNENAKKFTYAEVWGLAISKDGLNAFSARDNECMVSDLSKFLLFSYMTVLLEI